MAVKLSVVNHPVGPRSAKDHFELDLEPTVESRPVTGHVDDVVARRPAAHASGDFSTGIAIRQAFVEAEKIMGTGAFVWLGSRMARGDTSIPRLLAHDI